MPLPPNKKPPTNVTDALRAKISEAGDAVLGLLAAVVLIVMLVAVASQQQSISDWWRLRGYSPPAAIVKLADQDTMNSYTRHMFYLNRPQLLNTVTAFRQHCPENKDTIVLGCYHAGQSGIYIYNVQDPALAGIQQVTAAHEVLHAVYARLSTKDRDNLDTQLENFYKHGLSDPRVLAEVQIYQKTEPGAVMDEMSCTFGTEVANLPPGLESYYKKYFINRSAIVAYEQQYEGEFTSRQNTITSDDQQLGAMKQQIDGQEAALKGQLSQINTDQSRLNGLLAASQRSAYNAAVPGYNQEVDTYNAGVNSLRRLINSYNQLVATRNAVAGELTTLDQAIDTRQIPQTAH